MKITLDSSVDYLIEHLRDLAGSSNESIKRHEKSQYTRIANFLIIYKTETIEALLAKNPSDFRILGRTFRKKGMQYFNQVLEDAVGTSRRTQKDNS